MNFERMGGGLVNIVLGALILWVGQTTFHHAGELAGVEHQFENVLMQHNGLRSRLDSMISDMENRTQSRFTREDGNELAAELKEIIDQVDSLERRLVDRVTALQLKVIALETHRVDRLEIARMQNDLQYVQRRMGNAATPSVAQSRPQFLPPASMQR